MGDTAASVHYQREPLMHYTKRMSDSFSQWQRISDYAIWTGHVQRGGQSFTLLEVIDGKIATVQKEGHAPLMHVVKAGNPHRVTHMFGYWHVSDSDVIWIHSPREEADYYMMIIGGVKGIPGRSTLQWYCPQCFSRLDEVSSPPLDKDFAAFTQFQLESVRRFNASPEIRACSSCATIHPLAYGFYPEADQATERQARSDW